MDRWMGANRGKRHVGGHPVRHYPLNCLWYFGILSPRPSSNPSCALGFGADQKICSISPICRSPFAVRQVSLSGPFSLSYLHVRCDWAAANSQVRTFLDALLDEIAVKLDPEAANLKSGQPRRTKLAAIGFLSRELNEWDDRGLGFINGLIQRLHPMGSHPGLSDGDDSAFRLHIVLITGRLMLARFDALTLR